MEELSRSNPDLAQAVRAVTEQYPDTLPVFEQVIQHYQRGTSSERPHKRIKTEEKLVEIPEEVSPFISSTDAAQVELKNEAAEQAAGQTLVNFPDISFISPARRKLILSINEHSITARKDQTSDVEVDIPFSDIALFAVLPVPERAVKGYNFCIFRKSGADTSVFTVPDMHPLRDASGPALDKLGVTATSFTAQTIRETLSMFMPSLHVWEPDLNDFQSVIPQAHRRREPASWITCHRGSKEGYLFFLPVGLVFGFKRPLLYLPLTHIVSVTYNDILNRTFNLTVAMRDPDDAENDVIGETQVEFSMIDAAEHDGVDKYINKYQLNNASLSESRRAKVGKRGQGQTSQTNGDIPDDKYADKVTELSNAVAASVTGIEMPSEDEEGDADFNDDESHGGSTIASDDSEAENSDEASDIDIEQETDDEDNDNDD